MSNFAVQKTTLFTTKGPNSINCGALSPRLLRVLAAIAFLQKKGKPLKIRALMKVLGKKSPNAIKPCLDLLRKNGLIDMLAHAAAAVTVTCKFIPADQLTKE